MEELVQIIIRSFLAIATLFVLTKVMGQKELSQLSIFDYIIGISIGSIAAQMAFDVEETWYEFMIVLLIYVGTYYMINWLSLKSLWLRKFFDGVPIILMQNGKLIDKNLRRVRYDVNTFLEACRMAGYYDIATIDTAIMETSGRVSFLPKVSYRTVQVGDLGIKPPPETLVANLIIDGKILVNNVKALEKDEQWLKNQIRKISSEPIEHILLATYTPEDKVKIYLKNETFDVKNGLE